MTLNMSKIIILALILYLQRVQLDSCKKHETCHECIRDASVCVWCASKTYNSEERCKPFEFTRENSTWCSDSLKNPESTSTPTDNEPFSSNASNVIQLKPQKYELNLRPGQTQEFSFSVKWVPNYPVDIYFLFDSSQNMKKVRANTAQQSENIYNTLIKLTNDVFMGMGIFVDKNMLPYTLDIKQNKAFSFKHHLNFTNEYKVFQKAVDDIPLGGNRDLPEGGLDALAQAITCQPELRWREQSRKILVLMTNGPYHAAGDGKSAGVFKPYDGKCYTVNNVYTQELTMDYPSVSMINKLARDNHVVVIFAVSEDMTGIYNKLGSSITGSKTVNLDYNSKSDEIVTKLKEIYEEITTKIKLNLNLQDDPNSSARLKDFKILFEPDCIDKSNSACSVAINDIKNISGTIKLLEYGGYNKTKINIAVEGIAEKLTLDINIISGCDCEIESNSTYCNGERQECGVCHCNEPKYGDKCQCNRLTMKLDSNSTCQTDDIKVSCSGRGSCSCGKCSCQPEYAGPYCQCFLKNCPMGQNNLVCNGHGECQCNEKCKCDPGWFGDACDCYDTEKLCLAPNNKVCNGRGDCNCGSCACKKPEEWDSRNEHVGLCVYNLCPGCHGLQCKVLSDCALCLQDEEKTCNCSFVHDIIRLDKLQEKFNNSDDDPEWLVCKKIRVDMGCYTDFAYKYDEEQYGLHLMLQKDQNCAESQYIYGGIVLLCMLLVGIFTLLGWKLITYLRDRREYLQFMKNHVPDSSPCQNPLYEPATTTFRNPAFQKRPLN